MVCADTDFIADLDRGKKEALEKLDEFEQSGETVYTTSVTVAELYHGAHNSADSARATDRIEKILRRFSILNLDYDSAKLWGSLARILRSNSIGELDLFVASIALANNQTLITRNTKHFERVPRLNVDSW